MSNVENKIYCSGCDCLIGEDDVYYLTIDDETICQDCASSMYECHSCNRFGDEEQFVPVRLENGETVDYCHECLRHSPFYQCDCCCEWVHRDDLTPVRGHDSVCSGCLEEHYVQCHGCGEWVYSEFSHYDEDSDYDYCGACWEERTNIIHDYHAYDKDWQFRGKDEELHFGIELEIEGGGEDDDNAIVITAAMGYPADESNEIRVSHDGSLTDGMEIISNPYTYEYHMHGIDWIAGLKEARRLGYVSHDGGNCGLHAHVDVAYFRKQGYKDRKQLENVIAVLMFNNKEWLSRFSRRRNWHYCQFPTACEESIRMNLLEPRVYFRDLGKYSAVNFMPYNTIEFRLIRGTLIPETFIAALQLINLIGKALSIYKTRETIKQAGAAWFLSTARTLGYNEFIQEFSKRCTATASVSYDDDDDDDDDEEDVQ